MAEEENKVEPVLLPPEAKDDPAAFEEAPPSPAPAATATPEEPASKMVEWLLAVAMMAVLVLVFWMFLSFMRMH